MVPVATRQPARSQRNCRRIAPSASRPRRSAATRPRRCRARDSAPAPRPPDGRSGCGSPPAPAASAGRTASRKASLDEVLLPWCGTSSTSARQRPRRAPAARLLRLLDVAGQQAPCCAPLAMRSTQLRALGLRAGLRSRPAAGCSTSKSTPSQSQRWPAAQRCDGRSACSAWPSSIELSSAACGCMRQHRRGAAGVVAVAVAQHQRVHPLAQRAQQRHQHALAGVAFAGCSAGRRRTPGVWRGGAHEHRVALADVGRQQLELRPAPAAAAATAAPAAAAASPAARSVPGQPHRQQHAARHARRAGPQRRRRRWTAWRTASAASQCSTRRQRLHAPRPPRPTAARSSTPARPAA